MTVPRENQLDALLPPLPPEEVTRWTVCSMLWNTPSAEKKKYSTATATIRMTNPTSEARKLNFMTDHGSILDSTSCASLAAIPSCRTPLGVSCGVGVAAGPDLLLTVTADLPLPIAPPGFPTALGLDFFFFFPGLAKGIASLDFKSSDRTDPGGAGPAGGEGTRSGACISGS